MVPPRVGPDTGAMSYKIGGASSSAPLHAAAVVDVLDELACREQPNVGSLGRQILARYRQERNVSRRAAVRWQDEHPLRWQHERAQPVGLVEVVAFERVGGVERRTPFILGDECVDE